MTYIDGEAKISPGVWVGQGTAIWGLARIHEDVHLGDFCSVGELTHIGRAAKIGDRTRIGALCYIVDHMTIGQNCFIAPGVFFANDRYPKVNHPHFKREDPVVEDDVSIGMNATILPGVRLGRGCQIGAGAVVTHDVPPYETWAGNPARRLRQLDPTRMEFGHGPYYEVDGAAVEAGAAG